MKKPLSYRQVKRSALDYIRTFDKNFSVSIPVSFDRSQALGLWHVFIQYGPAGNARKVCGRMIINSGTGSIRTIPSISEILEKCEGRRIIETKLFHQDLESLKREIYKKGLELAPLLEEHVDAVGLNNGEAGLAVGKRLFMAKPVNLTIGTKVWVRKKI